MQQYQTQESVYTRIHKTLSWKRIIGFNLLMLLVLVVPLSVKLAQEDTENRSSAAGEDTVESVPTPPPSYPSEGPQLERVSMFYGKSGDAVVLVGNNFGDYQWASSIYVGNAKASEDDIVRWSDKVVEVNIPQDARTGKVWIDVNENRATWEGSLLLYNVSVASKIGLEGSGSNYSVWLEKGETVTRGVIHLGYVNDPISVGGIGAVEVISFENIADSLSKISEVEFTVSSPLARASTDILSINYGGSGYIEIIRVELFDSQGRLIEVFSDPFSVKLGL